MKVTAFAPATVANLNCGFDVLGLAIDAPGDEVTVMWNDTGEVRIVSIEGDGGKLSLDPQKNTATGGILTLLERVLSEPRGVDVVIKKKMPFGSGLGSSAASAVAGVVAMNALLGNPLTRTELVEFALDGEVIASGSRHADNVAPSLLGGIVLIRSYHPLSLIELPVPEALYVTVIHPHIEILTKEARDILPKQVSMPDAIRQTGNIAAFTSALYKNDLTLLAESMVDVFAEPYRANLLPHFDEVKSAALAAGAISFGISGSGPSMFAFTNGEEAAYSVAQSMRFALEKYSITADTYTSPVNRKGAIVW